MFPYSSKAIKKYPFFRLVCALAGGIFFEWYVQAPLYFLFYGIGAVLIFLLLIKRLEIARKYNFRGISGILVLAFFLFVGANITYLKDPRKQLSFYENVYSPGNPVLLTIREDLSEKNKSFKTVASVDGIFKNGIWVPATGHILVYLSKKNGRGNVHAGMQLITTQSLNAIQNSGNPNAFDYNRYALFQGFTAQVFLKQQEYWVIGEGKISTFQTMLINWRRHIIEILQQHIPDPKLQGVAEALLIGYRDDLDKSLVQAYSNTGVIHIIAISGLHLGMIFVLLSGILANFKKVQGYRFFRPCIILAVLWLFTFLAGAVPSVLRAAVMFSFLVLGETMNRQTNTLNTLAASAFLLLVINPYYLWDAGFQLSFAAVGGIVSFLRPINNWFLFENKIMRGIWSLMAVTLSAQVFTLPIILYYFHQFPVFFLISNLLVVPLSGIILYGEILLLIFSSSIIASKLLDTAICFLLSVMNGLIVHMDKMPFGVITGLQVNAFQALLLYLIIFGCLLFLHHRIKTLFWVSFSFACLFCMLISFYKIKSNYQEKLVVYNIPGHAAMDLLLGRQAYFYGDSGLEKDFAAQKYTLKPAREYFRIQQLHLYPSGSIIICKGKKIFIANQQSLAQSINEKTPIDILILSRNPDITIPEINRKFQFRQLVFDASNPLWKTERWKRDCERLNLRFHSVSASGAFEMDL